MIQNPALRLARRLVLRSLSPRSGFTMIEALVSVGLATVAFLMLSKFLGGTRTNFLYGTVNLQNLQEARLAVNYLRRDFSSACVKFSEASGDPDSYRYVQEGQKRIFTQASGWNPKNPSGLIQVLPQQLAFHRFLFDSPSEKPRVEPVAYTFDAAARTLTRTAPSRTITFKGFDAVEFKVYTHSVNPAVPILWARFKIHEGENMYGTADIGEALEFTTSISSAFVASNLNDLAWNYETYHQ